MILYKFYIGLLIVFINRVCRGVASFFFFFFSLRGFVSGFLSGLLLGRFFLGFFFLLGSGLGAFTRFCLQVFFC